MRTTVGKVKLLVKIVFILYNIIIFNNQLLIVDEEFIEFNISSEDYVS